MAEEAEEADALEEDGPEGPAVVAIGDGTPGGSSEWDGLYDLNLVADAGGGYDLGRVCCENRPSVAMVGIAWFDPSVEDSPLWAAFPASAFPRRIADRPMAPSLGITRLRMVEVPGCAPDDRGFPGEEKVQVKIGLLPQRALRWVTKGGGRTADFLFGTEEEPNDPFGPALLEALGTGGANESAGFLSASAGGESGVGEGRGQEGARQCEEAGNKGRGTYGGRGRRIAESKGSAEEA